MKKYQIIYADPPWRYHVYSKKGMGRSAESHYPTMSVDDICALPVGDLADKNCVLFLWVSENREIRSKERRGAYGKIHRGSTGRIYKSTAGQTVSGRWKSGTDLSGCLEMCVRLCRAFKRTWHPKRRPCRCAKITKCPAGDQSTGDPACRSSLGADREECGR